MSPRAWSGPRAWGWVSLLSCWKIADLQARSAAPSAALRACRSAVFEKSRKRVHYRCKAVFTRPDVTRHFTINSLCKTAASRQRAEKIHEAVAKDAKLQIQDALGWVSQEQTPIKKHFFWLWVPRLHWSKLPAIGYKIQQLHACARTLDFVTGRV